MSTRFGKFVKSRCFKVLFLLILTAAAAYMGLRAGNALEWGTGLSLYLPIFILLALLFITLAGSMVPGDGKEHPRLQRCVSGYFLAFLFYDVLIQLVFDIISLVFDFSRIVRAWLILAAAVLTLLLVVIGSIHARKQKLITYRVRIGNWPGNTRIVLLSDLHIGAFIDGDYLRRVFDKVNGAGPDVVVITGDIFDGCMPGSGQMADTVEAFRGLSAPMGVYAVTGNHDPDTDDKSFSDFLENANIHLLYNQAKELPGWYLIGRAGIVDMREVRVPLGEILPKAAERKPVVVLDHDPQGIREAAEFGADLVMCGHTHGGQFFPITILTRLANGRENFYGYGIRGRTQSIISAGTGFFTIPVRIGTDSEIVIIDVSGEADG